MNPKLSKILEGCQSHSCAIKKPQGQATNGKCRCNTMGNFLWLLNEVKALSGLREGESHTQHEKREHPGQRSMVYSVDGGQTWLKAPQGVRVSLGEIPVPDEDAPGQLDFNITSEGVITDVWVSSEGVLDHNIATSSTCTKICSTI